MANAIVADQQAERYIFNPPDLTQDMRDKLAMIFYDAAVVAQDLGVYAKGRKEESTLKLVNAFNEVAYELKHFFYPKSTDSISYFITQRIWDALREFFIAGLFISNQIEQCAYADESNRRALKVALNNAARFLKTAIELYDFININPYVIDSKV